MTARGACLFCCFVRIGAQTPVPNSSALPTVPQIPQSGVQTGSAHAPVLDAQHRPITAGGFVATGPHYFEDFAAKSGLTAFRHIAGTKEKRSILETIGAGVALLDYDNDGWLDVYLVNGSTYEAESGKAAAPHAALFHNNHDGTFTDVAAAAGVTNERWGMGAVVADYDNDGWPDIYVSNFGKNRLYHNNHDGTFTDVAEKAGVELGNWSAGATWGDYDDDGRLDLFVAGYVHLDPQSSPEHRDDHISSGYCQFRGVKVMCGPRGLKGEPDHLFHNNGDGTFTDVSVKAGVADAKPSYYGLASLFVDVDNDGRIDLVVANDSTPNYLYLNQGNGTFKDDSYASGYALNESGRETASMGIGVGDLWHNGALSIFNTTFSDDYKPLYVNDGKANFTDESYQLRIAEPTIPFLGWGAVFADFDNDGWLDLLTVNGHVYPQADTSTWGTTWEQRPLYFHSVHGQLNLAAPVQGSALAKLASARGLACGDLFNDGHIDCVANNVDSTPTLFRNVTVNSNHWIGLQLIGAHKGPIDPVGATVYLTANGFVQRQDLIAGGSFASSSDHRIHFGLGTATKIDKLEIHWPSGLVEQVIPPSIDQISRVTEGQGKIIHPGR